MYYDYTHAHTHIATINEKRGHEFKREQGRIFVRIWRDGKKRKNVTNIISKYERNSYVKSELSYRPFHIYTTPGHIINGFQANISQKYLYLSCSARKRTSLDGH